MMRSFACIGIVALIAGPVFSQSVNTAAAPKFEISDVHTSPDASLQQSRGPFYRAGRFELRTAAIVAIICSAYGIDNTKVVGGPNWLENEFFDVIAKGPPDATPETVKLMLQSLLADRFKLVVHIEDRPGPGWALTAGKKPRLTEADGSGDAGCNYKVTGVNPPGSAPGDGPPLLPTIEYTCRNMTMGAFVEGMLNFPGAQQYLGRPIAGGKVTPVVDRTELKGAWDFNFKYTPAGGPMGAASNVVTLFDAMDKQLGLKLESVKIPWPYLVVDSANEKPTPNLPEVAKALPPGPTEFEVAVVKPSAPDTPGLRFQIQPGGRLNITGATLKFLVEQIWRLTDDMLIGAPKSMENDRYDIVAKAPMLSSSTPGLTAPNGTPMNGAPTDIDTLYTMLRSLVTDRFKLAVHTEERPLTGYTLVAGKPKMKKGDPSNHSTCHFVAPPSDANPILGRWLVCRNITMAEFTAKLQGLAPDYFHNPVLDATGLEGRWDFDLSFSAAGQVQNGGGGVRGGDAVQAPVSDPNGAISLPDALEKQTGLKLIQAKRPLPVLVIDHVEAKPTDN